MNKKVREKTLESLADSSYGEALKDLVNEKIDELNNSSTIAGENKLVELEARQIAIKKLSDIFSKLKKTEPLPKRGREFE